MSEEQNSVELESMSPMDVMKTLQNLPGSVKPFSKPEDTTQADEENAIKAEQDRQVQQEAVAVAKIQTVQQVVRREPLTGVERAVAAVKRHLETYKTSPVGSGARVEAITKVVDIVTRTPKKSVLDAVLAFFKENRNSEMLSPMNALQNISALDKSVTIRLRILYQLMSDIACGRANKRNISLEMIRNIFGSDDFVNWVAVRISTRR